MFETLFRCKGMTLEVFIMLIVPDLHYFFLSQSQLLIFERNKLHIFVTISLSEFDGLVKIFSLFDKL